MFESIVGQETAVEAMKRAISRPVNSYVFYGSRGTFVEESARLFAARLIEESGSADDRVLKQLYADVIEFEPMGVNYRVKEDVRESMLVESRKSPVEGSRKVLIVHDAHLLRADSANTLLKSLEEPPENIFWILIAPSKDSLLATIRSRCYEIEFARLSNDLVEKILIEEGIESGRASQVAKVCSGRIDRARNLATLFAPLKNCAETIVSRFEKQSSFVASSAKAVTETFDEIASDVVAKNKLEMESVKKEMKDSGYSDKIASSIVSATKTRLEAKEKRLKHELLREFLDSLSQAFISNIEDSKSFDLASAVIAGDTINEYRKRLTYNPSELLFLESLLASISLQKFQANPVNS